MSRGKYEGYFSRNEEEGERRAKKKVGLKGGLNRFES